MTLSSIPFHSSELPRIMGYRPHGFDNMNMIFDYFKAQLAAHGKEKFEYIKFNDENFLSLVVEPYKEENIRVVFDTGFIDFQDKSHTTLGKIDALYNKKDDIFKVITAFTEYGVATLDVEMTLIDMQDVLKRLP